MILLNIIFALWAGYELIHRDMDTFVRILTGIAFSFNFAVVLHHFARNI
jgi:hypothetical protein